MSSAVCFNLDHSNILSSCNGLTLSKKTDFRLCDSESESFSDDNFKLDENGRKVSRQVENTVGKGEIARYEQFLLFPQFFSKDLSCRYVKPGLI